MAAAASAVAAPNVPLVAGGAALALGSAGLGLFAYRRYRKTAA